MNFEVIVVDDGSADASPAVVESYGDPRLKLLRHTTNLGSGPARNTGIGAASSEWIISFDSDDELLPGALSRIHERIEAAGTNVERLAFMFRRDDGRVSPLPALRDEILDYASYVAWLEGRVIYDFLPCTKRFTFDTVRWEELRWADHCLYNLDFAKQFRTLFCSEIVARVHTDAGKRLSHERRTSRNATLASNELGEEMDLILSRHGDALRQFGPRTYEMYRRMRASYYFLSGERRKGLKQSRQCLRAAPFSPDAWLILILGLAGPRVLGEVRSWRPPAT